ncbi:MAG TPA: tetratricopeptide repeat protein [Micropepsaceae bacterium]|nr:tetratricopeptide repeat protein [Micropepsaceae bacterium]
MNFKVSASSPLLLQRASYLALALIVSSAAQAADKGKPDANAQPAAAAQAAPQSALPLAPGEIPSDLESAIKLAQTNRQNGDFAGASKILSQLVLFAPDDPRVLAEYGKTLAAQGRSDDALAFLERAIQLQPNEWSFYSAQGVAYDQKGNYQAAITSYNRALMLKPGEPTVLNNAALSRLQAGDLAGAEKFLMQAAPGAAQFPRISENLALVESMKTARATPVTPQPAPATPAAPMIAKATPAPAIESAPLPAPQSPAPPMMMASATPAPTMPVMPTMPNVEPPMPMPMPMQAEEANPMPAPASPSAQPSQPASKTLADLQSDPTVRMAPIPKDDKAGQAKPQPKPVEAKPVVAEAKPAPVKTAQAAAPKPADHSGAANAFYVQAGAYATQSRADQAAAALDSLGARVTPATVDGHAIFRVRIGPFLDIGQANQAVNQAQALGHTDLRIVNE